MVGRFTRTLAVVRVAADAYNPVRRAYNRGYADAIAGARQDAIARANALAVIPTPEAIELTETDLRALTEQVRETVELITAATTIPSGAWEDCILEDCPMTCCPVKPNGILPDCG